MARKKFSTLDSVFNMFLPSDDLKYVAFDPVNSYTLERFGKNSNILLEY
jgi:hypothetical protein